MRYGAWGGGGGGVGRRLSGATDCCSTPELAWKQVRVIIFLELVYERTIMCAQDNDRTAICTA